MSIAHQQALECAGVTESSALLLDFLRWRTIGVGMTLRQIVQEPGIGAVPLAAAWAAEGLQLLLGVVGSSQKLDPETFSAAEITANLNEARGCLDSAIANLDLMLDMIAAAGGRGRESVRRDARALETETVSLWCGGGAEVVHVIDHDRPHGPPEIGFFARKHEVC